MESRRLEENWKEKLIAYIKEIETEDQKEVQKEEKISVKIYSKELEEEAVCFILRNKPATGRNYEKIENEDQKEVKIYSKEAVGFILDKSISDADRLEGLLNILARFSPFLSTEYDIEESRKHHFDCKEISQKLFSNNNISSHDSCEEYKFDSEIVFSFHWGDKLTCNYQQDPEELFEIYDYRKETPDLKHYTNIDHGLQYLEEILSVSDY
jgi:hypothetical protein